MQIQESMMVSIAQWKKRSSFQLLLVLGAAMEYLLIFMVIMVVLGVIAAVGQASDRRKMQDLLDGKPMLISVPSVVEVMPIDEWRGPVGRARHEYFVEQCKSANKPTYEALLALQIQYDAAISKEEALLVEIVSTRAESEGKMDNPASFVLAL